MIESIEIHNFQKHENFELELDPDITTLVGKTDAGKSAILRAVRWLSLNDPSGESFIRNGSDFASVTMVVDGHKIERRRGKGENSYKLDGKPLVSFGIGKVPDPVAEILNLGEENFSGQHDSAFWLSDSAGEVSRKLNEIVNLSLIDSTLANVASSLRKARSEEEVTKTRLKEAKERRDSLVWAVEAEEELKTIEQKQIELEKKRLNLARIFDLLEKLGKLLSEHWNASGAALDAGKAFGMLEQVESKQRKATRLEELLKERVKLGKLAKIAKPLEKDKMELEEREKRIKTMTTNVEKLSLVLVERNKLIQESQMNRSKAEGVEKELKELIGENCPVCGKAS